MNKCQERKRGCVGPVENARWVIPKGTICAGQENCDFPGFTMNDRFPISLHYQAFQWRSWMRGGDFLRENINDNFYLKNIRRKCLASLSPWQCVFPIHLFEGRWGSSFRIIPWICPLGSIFPAESKPGHQQLSLDDFTCLLTGPLTSLHSFLSTAKCSCPTANLTLSLLCWKCFSESPDLYPAYEALCYLIHP